MAKVKELKVEDLPTYESLFEGLEVGVFTKIPFDKSRHIGIKTEMARQHKYARLRGENVTTLNPIFRISEIEYPGYTTIIRMR